MNANVYVTKTDLSAAIDRVIKEMAEVFNDGMQMIAERFAQVDKRLDRIEERLDRVDARLDSVEDKLDRSIARIDIHDVDIRQLRRKAI